VHVESRLYLNLIGLAMPCLEQLSVHLKGASLGDCGLFTGLQQCTQLSVLGIHNFDIPAAAVKPAGAALAHLKALRSLTLTSSCDTNPAGLLAQLTSLTALVVESPRADHIRDMVVAAARNSGLRVMSVSVSGAATPSTFEWSHLLTSCPLVETLNLTYDEVPEDVLDVLLTHGTNITSLDTFTITPTTSFAHRPCRWERLGLRFDKGPSLLQLAYLPLHSVTDLDVPDERAGFVLPLVSVPADQLPSLLRQAASNLAGCPAWQADPESSIALWSSETPPEKVVLTPHQRIQLLEALAPLGGPHIEEFEAHVHDAVFKWGRPEVQALGRSLSSEHLESLQLDCCILTAGFWAALGDELPSLSSLYLHRDVTLSAFDLAVFCSKARQGDTLTISLNRELYESVNGGELQASLVDQGLVHTQIVKW
jgi:hypothetical protein